MRMRIIGHFEERQEDIVDDLLEVCHKLIQLKDITIQKMQTMKICRVYVLCSYISYRLTII